MAIPCLTDRFIERFLRMDARRRALRSATTRVWMGGAGRLRSQVVMCPPRTHRLDAGRKRRRQAGRVAGSIAEEGGGPATGASGAEPASSIEVSTTGTRTPVAVVGAAEPFGDPWPAPGPPHPPT